jgi:hypothetical protein
MLQPFLKKPYATTHPNKALLNVRAVATFEKALVNTSEPLRLI